MKGGCCTLEKPDQAGHRLSSSSPKGLSKCSSMVSRQKGGPWQITPSLQGW